MSLLIAVNGLGLPNLVNRELLSFFVPCHKMSALSKFCHFLSLVPEPALDFKVNKVLIKVSYFWLFILLSSLSIFIVAFVEYIPSHSSCPSSCIRSDCTNENSSKVEPCRCSVEATPPVQEEYYCTGYVKDNNTVQYQLFFYGVPLSVMFMLLSSICLCHCNASEHQQLPS